MDRLNSWRNYRHLTWVLGGVIVLLCLLFYRIIDAPNSHRADFHSSIIDLNSLISKDKDLRDKLTLIRSGLLKNYDGVVADLHQMEKTLQRLSDAKIAAEGGDVSGGELKYASMVRQFKVIQEVVESLKSDLAAIQNFSKYLPELILESLSQSASRDDLSRTMLTAHIRLFHLIDYRAYGDDARYRADDLDSAIEILHRNGNHKTVAFANSIRKHFDVMALHQQRIVKNFRIINQMNFSGSTKKLLSHLIDAHDEHDERTSFITFVLQISVAILLLLTFIGFLRVSWQSRRLKRENAYSNKMNAALGKLAEVDIQNIDSVFFDVCIKNLIEACGCCFAYAAFLDGKDHSILRTQSVWLDGERQEAFAYSLKGAPCEKVLLNRSCFIEEDVATKYPDDAILSDLGLQSYFGHALVDANDTPIGLIALMNRLPTQAEGWIKSLLEIFAIRISVEAERFQGIKALSKQKDEAITTLNAIANGVIKTDASGWVTAINPAARKMLSIDKEFDDFGQYAQNVFRCDEASESNEFVDKIKHCLRTHQSIVDNKQTTLLVGPGNELTVHLSVAPILDGGSQMIGVVAVLHDVSNEQKYRRELAFHATHDSLTGLLNRRALEAHLDNVLEDFYPNASNALIYIDIDRFKVVNDTCGHGAGDVLLQKVATLLKNQIRDSDVLARLGGDEFFIVLANCTMPSAITIVDKILHQASTLQFFWQENIFQISVSIGLTVVNSGDYTRTELMSIVDMACLQAKKEGRNRFSVAHPNDTRLLSRKKEGLWMPRLQKAIDLDQFALYQQPIVKANESSGESPESLFSHTEILLRMRDEKGEIIMPYEFLGAAERYGLMVEIDRWVVSNVLAKMADSNVGTPLYQASLVAINLSGLSLADQTLLDFILDEIAQSGVDPRRLCFEVTETAAIANQTNAVQLIRKMQAVGCSFALDDFGSGLSSYSYIKNLPADFLKIDREFTKNLVDDSINQAIVGSVIDVAHNIGMEAIAEGVEDKETRLILEHLGVDYMQGYIFSYPRPVDFDLSSSGFETQRFENVR